MAYKSFLIADQSVGLQRNRAPFLLPDDAYPELENAYLWRKHVKKKNGTKILGRLRRNLTALSQDDADGSGSYSDSDLLDSVRATEPQAQIIPGTVTFRFDPGGGNETIYEDSSSDGTLVYVSGPYTISSGSIDYMSGAVSLTFTAAPPALTTSDADLSYYPGLPCMALPTRELEAINAEQLLAFDTKYAYRYSNATDRFEEFITGTTWQGSNSDFFWSANYWIDGSGNNLFWTTNFNVSVAPDPIRYTDGTTWTTFAPTTNGTNEMHQAKILIPYRNRLVALFTYEGGTLATSTANPQRARWSQNGDPTDQTNGWRDDIIGRGGFIDAPTSERITSAAFLKDTLIVFFERSTWKLRYSGSEVLPFIWERVNVDFGSESTFSTIPFDLGPITVGDRGIIQTDGVNVRRIDLNIPDEIFSFHNDNAGPSRVHGARDFDELVIYFTFPNDSENGTFPNRVLLYNYNEGSWAILRDSFTCYGTWQSFSDLTWGEATMTWGEADFLWNSQKSQSLYPKVVAGNQQGFVSVVQEKTTNDQTLRLEGITLASPGVFDSTDHNLSTGDYVRPVNTVGTIDVLDGWIYQVERIDDDSFRLLEKPKFNITAITQANPAQVTAAGNNFNVGDLCQIRGVSGMTEINDITARVLSTGDTFTLDLDSTGFTAYSADGQSQNLMAPLQYVDLTTETFLGFGEFERVDNFTIRSKKFNPYLSLGASSQLGKIDFYNDVTTSGKYTVNLYVDDNDTTPVNEPSDNQESNVVETFLNPFETIGQDKVWHTLYDQVDGSFFQYEIELSEAQMSSNAISSSDFVLYAVNLWHQLSSRRLT